MDESERESLQQQQQSRAPSMESATTTSETAALMMKTAFSNADAVLSEAVADNETGSFSLGDVPHANGSFCVDYSITTKDMTVSSGVKTNEDTEMVSVEESDFQKTNVAKDKKKGWKEYNSDVVEDRDEEEEEGGRLFEENEAINLCSKDIQQTTSLQQNQQLQGPVKTMLSAKMRLKKQRQETEAGLSSPSTTDGLQQLAEAAEIKQVSLFSSRYSKST
jgi:hypothetical protein